MRIDSLGRPLGAPSAPRPAASSGAFSLSNPQERGETRQAAALRPAPSLDALIALQAIEPESPRERKRRALARGRSLLDSLDEMKLALIEGRDDPSALVALARRLAERRGDSGESDLEDVLSAIELRAQVELAKRAR